MDLNKKKNSESNQTHQIAFDFLHLLLLQYSLLSNSGHLPPTPGAASQN
jgi:hypothetical protein